MINAEFDATTPDIPQNVEFKAVTPYLNNTNLENYYTKQEVNLKDEELNQKIDAETQRAKNVEDGINSSLSIQKVRIADIISHLNSGLISNNMGLICKPDVSHTAIVTINKLPAQKYTFYADIIDAIDGDIVFKLVKNNNVIVTLGTILEGDVSFENVINIEEDYEDIKLHIIAPIVQERTYADVYYSFIPEKTITETIDEISQTVDGLKIKNLGYHANGDFLDSLTESGLYRGGYYDNNRLYKQFDLTVINNPYQEVTNISQFMLYNTPYGKSGFIVRYYKGYDHTNTWTDWQVVNRDEISDLVSDEISKILDGTDPDKIDSLKDLIAWVEKHGTEAAAMAKAIETNTTNISTEVLRATNAEEELRKSIDNKDFDILQRTTITLVDNQDENKRGTTPKVFKTGDVVKFELGVLEKLGGYPTNIKTYAIFVRVGDKQKEIGKLSKNSPYFTHIFTEDCYDNSIWCWTTDGEKTDVNLYITITQINSELQDTINANDNSVFEYIRQHKNGGEVFLKSIKPANTRFRVEWLECTEANPERRNLLLHNVETGAYITVAELGLHESIELTPNFAFDLIGLMRAGAGHLLRITWLDSPIAKFIEEKAGNTKVIDLGYILDIEENLDNITEEGVYKGTGFFNNTISYFELTVGKRILSPYSRIQTSQLLVAHVFESNIFIKSRTFDNIDDYWTDWQFINESVWDRQISDFNKALRDYKKEANARLDTIEALPIVTTEPTEEELPDVPEYITREDLDNAIAEAITNTINTPV